MRNPLLDLVNAVYNRLVFAYRKPICQERPTIHGRIFIVSERGGVRMGEGVRINSSLRSNPIGGMERCILFAAKGATISIGSHTGISNSAIVARERIDIGSRVLIGGNCKIYDTDFHSVDYAQRMQKPDVDAKSAPVVIQDGAFIGAHSLILKGVTIGERSVVAANSVVTKSIPSMQLWGGNPAKFIRSLEADRELPGPR